MVGGFLLLLWANYYHNDKQKEQKSAEKYIKDLEKAYREDTYGGKTPEETLALFIDALKKGDIDLAVKYMIIEEQENMSSDLKEAKNTDRIDKVIQNLVSLRLSQLESNNATFTSVDSSNVVKYQAFFARASNGIWKIVDL